MKNAVISFKTHKLCAWCVNICRSQSNNFFYCQNLKHTHYLNIILFTHKMFQIFFKNIHICDVCEMKMYLKDCRTTIEFYLRFQKNLFAHHLY